MAQAVSRPPSAIASSTKAYQTRGRDPSTVSGSRNNHGDAKEYIVVITNLPFLLDTDNYQRLSNAVWKPIKDLLRKAINKADDGTNFTTQTATPNHVKVLPEMQGWGGHAICTLKQQAHVERVLRWLGGNLWYGSTLGVLICCKVEEEHRVVESRWTTIFPQPYNLNSLSAVSDRSMLRSAPLGPLSPPFRGALRPNSRVRIPFPMTSPISSNTLSLTRQGCISTHSLSPGPPSRNVPVYSARQPCYAGMHGSASINIMIQIEDQNWRPYRSSAPPRGETLGPLCPFPFSGHPTTLSPTAASFPPILASTHPFPHPSVPYHTNPDGTLINTTHGAIPVSAPTSVMVRNLHHRTSRSTLEAVLRGSGCAMTRYEIKEYGGVNGHSKKKVTAVVGFATTGEATKAKTLLDGKELEKRRLSAELMKDDESRQAEEISRGDRTDFGNRKNSEDEKITSRGGHSKSASQGSKPVIVDGLVKDF